VGTEDVFSCCCCCRDMLCGSGGDGDGDDSYSELIDDTSSRVII